MDTFRRVKSNIKSISNFFLVILPLRRNISELEIFVHVLDIRETWLKLDSIGSNALKEKAWNACSVFFIQEV